MIRLYGVTKGNGSWARVTAGICGALSSLEQLSGFYDIERVDNDGAMDDGDAMEPGYDAEVGLCIGPPPAAGVMTGRGSHKRRLLMIATNSTWLPDQMMKQAAKYATGFVGTSLWATEVIKNYSQGLPVCTFQHGVDEAFAPDFAELYAREGLSEQGIYRVLHLASTHMQRKGTRELIAGWAKAYREKQLPERAELHLCVDGPRGYFLEEIHKACSGDTKLADSYFLDERLDLRPSQMARFYCSFNLVCQPSRAEGFGLVPLEARASGVPVAATTCTGHRDHFGGAPGTVVVHSGPEWTAIDDGPGAMAPSLASDDIAEALGSAYTHRVALEAEALDYATTIRTDLSWYEITKEFIGRLQ